MQGSALKLWECHQCVSVVNGHVACHHQHHKQAPGSPDVVVLLSALSWPGVLLTRFPSLPVHTHDCHLNQPAVFPAARAHRPVHPNCLTRTEETERGQWCTVSYNLLHDAQG